MVKQTGIIPNFMEGLCDFSPRFSGGDWACIESARGNVGIKATLTDEVKPGVISTTFHFPELMVNMVSSDTHDSEAKCPEFKVVAVRIRKARRVQERDARV